MEYETNLNIYHLKITNMTCGSCVSRIEKALRVLPGVTHAEVNFADHSAIIKGDTPLNQLISAIEKAGYRAAELFTNQQTDQTTFQNLMTKAGLAGLFGLLLMVANSTSLSPKLNTLSGQITWLVLGIITLAIFMLAAGDIYKNAWRTVRTRVATMDTLIALSTGIAWLSSMVITIIPDSLPSNAQHVYFESALFIIAFIQLGSALELRMREKATNAIQSLLELTPKKARVIRHEKEIDLALNEIVEGDYIHVKPGEKIPVDGKIIQGHSYIDESMLTGEAIAIEKQTGSTVIGGTLNQSGSFIYCVTHSANDSLLQKIIAQVKHAQNIKPPIAKFADQIASVFVPSVILIAVIAACIWDLCGPVPQSSYVILCLINVLIIACPCALGLATPLAIMAGVSKAAKHGILIRSGDALQRTRAIKTIVLDKTGTITIGKPRISCIYSIIPNMEDRVLQMLASIEQHSEHPLAKAITHHVQEKKLDLFPVEGFNALPGEGVEAFMDGRRILFGNDSLMKNHQIDITAFKEKAQPYLEEGHTVMYCAIQNKLIAFVAAHDLIKPDSAEAIDKMHALGLTVIMLSGDNKKTARAIAKQVNIDVVIAEVSPLEKAKKIEELKSNNNVVGMVGDGINDAAALAAADVGFAIGSGADVTLESADLVLMGNSLHGVCDAITISNATLRNIKQNFIGAFVYNCLSIPLAAGILYPITGTLLNPMVAGLAMALSSLTVVLNASRLR